jgi:GNAT superfamily N-acetyltransferase
MTEQPPDYIKLRDFAYGSEAYQASLTLRTVFLRLPLGLSLSEADLAAESEQFHLGAFNQDWLEACCVLKPLSRQWRLRQMAVGPQNQGIGSALLSFAEDFARQRHCRLLELYARVSAAEFYLHRGYHRDMNEFIEVGIPHCRMWKELSTSA